MARINLEQLKTFLSVVRLGGVRKASLGLHVTQPAVTARIKNLEDTLSAELFDRTTTGLKLTKRGEMLLKYAEQFEHLSELVEENIIAPEGIENHLRLGVSETIAQSWLPEFVSALHRKFPKLEIEISVDISVTLRAGLLDREIDLAILLDPPPLSWSTFIVRNRRIGVHPISGPAIMRPFGLGSIGPQNRLVSSFRAMNAAGFHCNRSSIH